MFLVTSLLASKTCVFLEFSTEGPSQSEIQSVDNGDNTALVEYKPLRPGVYKVNVLNKGEHIKDSPFVVMIDPERTDKSGRRARIIPSDSNASDLRVGEPFEFFVECKKRLRFQVLLGVCSFKISRNQSV